MNITHPKNDSQDLKIINFGFSKRQWQGQEDIKSKKEESVKLMIKFQEYIQQRLELQSTLTLL